MAKKALYTAESGKCGEDCVCPDFKPVWWDGDFPDAECANCGCPKWAHGCTPMHPPADPAEPEK